MPENQTKNPNLQTNNAKTALNLARWGCKVFPCDPGTKKPKPGLKWRDEATSDLAQIRDWWEQYPDAMPALPTGSANAVSVIDLDVRPDKDGITAYRDKGLDPDDATVIVKTAGGGLHLYFDHQPGIRNKTTKAGIDVRGEGGYRRTAT